MIPFELVTIFNLLQSPETRSEGAVRLAQYSGAKQVLIFGKDQEVAQFLPAAGMPQTLREGARWQVFLKSCEQQHRTTLPDPVCADREIEAYGVADPRAHAILVFLGNAPKLDVVNEISVLLPSLGAMLVLECRMLAADGHAQAAREASRLAGTLNEALDINRRELQTAYHKLEQELNSRRAAEQKLLDADRRKDEFLAMLAHELRNPLAPIAMAAQLLKIGPSSPARLTQTCNVIDRQIAHMTRLLDDLLDVSRVTGGMVTLAQELVDFRAIVGEALEQARPLIHLREHRLSVALPEQKVWVRGDATRLVQIVTNLLNNAAKYTMPSGDIGVQLEVRHDEVFFTVRDTGIGIDSALLPHVFDIFIQGERSSDRTLGGLGLGLALVKSLVDRHGGKVLASSDGNGKGSQFEVTLPCVRFAEIESEPPPASSSAPAVALSILIVDDNEDAAATLAMYLEAHGHEVRTAFDAASALKVALHTSPRVLVLDIGLPDMDGCVLAAKLRALPETRESILIALTGYGHVEDRERTNAAGFDHHLTKPVVASQLTQLLETATSQG